MAAPKLRFKEFDADYTNTTFEKLKGFSIQSGKSEEKGDTGEFPFYGSTGVIGYKDIFDYEGKSILIARVGANAGSLYQIDGKYSVSDNTLRLTVSDDTSLDYLRELLIKFNLNRLVFGTGQPLVTGGMIKKVNIFIPEFTEQTKIASFLSNVDEKISQLTQKHALLSQYKQGMMQKLFSQQIRFKADDGGEFGEWALSKLANYINEFKSTSKIQDEYEVLTSSRKGLIRQAEYFEGSRLVDRENIGYNIIQPNQITYRSRSDDGLFFFNLNRLGITGIISTYYPVFTMKNSDNRFFHEYLNFYKQEYVKYAVGTSQLVLSLNELRNMKFKIPCLEEQTKIANFLSAIDQKIEVVAQQIEQAKQWKKGLLQQMFV